MCEEPSQAPESTDCGVQVVPPLTARLGQRPPLYLSLMLITVDSAML